MQRQSSQSKRIKKPNFPDRHEGPPLKGQQGGQKDLRQYMEALEKVLNV